MATTLPFGIRVAAGLVGTSFDRLVKLPGELPGLTVSFAGQLLRTSMRVRQEVAELATRGDELLAPLLGGAEEHPAWATFDEDEEDTATTDTDRGGADPGDGPGATPPAGAAPDETTPRGSTAGETTAGQTTAGAAGPESTGGGRTAEPILVTGAERAGADIPLDETFGDDDDDLSGTATTDASERDGSAGDGSANDSVDDGLPPNAEPQDPTRTLLGTLGVEGATGASATTDRDAEPNPEDFLDLPADPAAGADDLVFSTTSDSSDSAIPADHELTVAELKDRLQDLDSAAVQNLLAQEESGPNRAAYLTLLTNRLTTLQHENR